MPEHATAGRYPGAWIAWVAVIILLIFLYFYQPFEDYLTAYIPHIHFANVIFWFASLVGVIGYALAHWQAFRQHIFLGGSNQLPELQVSALVFDTLQIAILVALIFTAGATLQAIAILSKHLMDRGPFFDAVFGEKLLAIVLLVILSILFYLLHYAVRAFRQGWQPRRQPPRGGRVSN